MTVLPMSIIVSAIVCEYSGLDIWWESSFFNESTHSWPCRDHWLFEQVIHERGRFFNIFAAGLFLGGVYGLGQQVRGTHFPSHDLFSMVICWYAALYIYYLFYPKQWRGFFDGPHNF